MCHVMPDAKVTIGGESGVHITKTAIGSEIVPAYDIFTKRIKVGEDSIRINKNKILFGSGTSITEDSLGSGQNPFKNSFTENLIVNNNAIIKGNLNGNIWM